MENAQKRVVTNPHVCSDYAEQIIDFLACPPPRTCSDTKLLIKSARLAYSFRTKKNGVRGSTSPYVAPIDHDGSGRPSTLRGRAAFAYAAAGQSIKLIILLETLNHVLQGVWSIPAIVVWKTTDVAVYMAQPHISRARQAFLGPHVNNIQTNAEPLDDNAYSIVIVLIDDQDLKSLICLLGKRVKQSFYLHASAKRGHNERKFHRLTLYTC